MIPPLQLGRGEGTGSAVDTDLPLHILDLIVVLLSENSLTVVVLYQLGRRGLLEKNNTLINISYFIVLN